MNFTDPCFLFLLLPVILAAYYCTPAAGKNFVLLAGSLVFYALGEGWATFVVVASIAINFFLGQWIEKSGGREEARFPLAVGVFVNLFLLCVFKYIAFFVLNLNYLIVALGGHALSIPKVNLPLGISFFTFHALSYVTDVWRQEVKPMKKVSAFALY